MLEEKNLVPEGHNNMGGLDGQFGMTEDFGFVQHQLFTAIPGAKSVQQVLPWREEDDGTTKYEQFVDGICYRLVKNVRKKCEEKTIIRKTVKNGNVIERYHTLDYWDNRASAKYVPICQPLDGFKRETRLFE